MMLHNAVRDAKPGDIIEVKATDPSTQRDIPKFCQFLGHELVQQNTQDEYFFYYIKKSEV
ncbi:sulfurtransferase TusA family protein [Teredinibacter sp. KSP-S5-2]|uniref:sulfurtransferase TusA family protein n=1 Tax=Teredinibacter sp. KSP-S5-2 TaxID=3034506 RepID=UPI002934E9CB|nr:sulfurtransferase TusA family protein [Teredinibacter sp. KSP-S5-2]WNO11695.1 sulfurtransferase TusA family protein [Teredinibacter sp. KSP-S5-2]